MSTYSVPRNLAPDVFFASLPSDATEVLFDMADKYPISQGDIVLPRRDLLVIDGCGAKMDLGPNSNGFTTVVRDQQDAMAKTASRYEIKNFGMITGGKRAVNLAATLGSSVHNIEVSNQNECAVDLRFCLLAKVYGVLITNPVKDGIRVGVGDWPGATQSNSASNGTILEQVRVNNQKISNIAFFVHASNGVKMLNCTSEGGGPNYDLVVTCADIVERDGLRCPELEPMYSANAVVKQFRCTGFHSEGLDAKKANVYVNMPSRAPTVFSECYFEGNGKAPIIEYIMGQLVLEQVGWWSRGHWISSRISAPRINVKACHPDLTVGAAVANNRSGSFMFSKNNLPTQAGLKTMYISVGGPNN